MTAMTTSRIARKPVTVPSGVEIKLNDKQLSIKGPKGSQTITLHPYVNVNIENNQMTVAPVDQKTVRIPSSKKRLYRSIPGTVRALLANLVNGVVEPYVSTLKLVGVGYRAQAKGKVLSLSLGFSHPCDFPVPEGITIETPTQTEIKVSGVNSELVGEVAAKIREFRAPEPYKGKGVRYADENVQRKEAKKK